MNNATCQDNVAGYNCACAPGWKGAHCEIDIDECDSAPCYNGAKCLEALDWYECECVLGYTGTDCETGGLQNLCFIQYDSPCIQ